MPDGEKKVIRRVGGVRPSQLMYAFGIGSVVDLPNFSVVVGGLDDWDEAKQAVITEERLLAAVRAEPGLEAVRELRSAPWEPETRNAFDSWAFTGVPVTPFPRWLRCSRCAYLAPIDSGLFELETSPYRPDRARYVHKNCSGRGRAPTAVPARFVVACSRGHLDEFPWIEFVHKDAPCSGNPILEAIDLGTGSRSTDVMVRCRTCQQRGFMAQAFGDGAEQVLPLCRGRSPHLRRFDADGCREQTTAMLLGASNAWFAVTRTVLSIPASGDATEQLVADHWAILGSVASRGRVAEPAPIRPRPQGARRTRRGGRLGGHRGAASNTRTWKRRRWCRARSRRAGVAGVHQSWRSADERGFQVGRGPPARGIRRLVRTDDAGRAAA